jgi:hypothetical protein
MMRFRSLSRVGASAVALAVVALMASGCGKGHADMANRAEAAATRAEDAARRAESAASRTEAAASRAEAAASRVEAMFQKHMRK